MLRIKSVYDNDCFTSKYDAFVIMKTYLYNVPSVKNIRAIFACICRVTYDVSFRCPAEVVGTQGKLKHRCPTLGPIDRDGDSVTVSVRKGRNQNKRWTYVVFFSFCSPSPMFVTDLFFLFPFVALVEPFWLISLLLAIF